jgi:signal transduction histidine kinase
MLGWLLPEFGSKDSPFAALARRLGGRWGLVAIFILIDLVLQWLGHEIQERPGTPTVMWPASGFMFAVFCLSGRSWWPLLGGLHILIESLSLQSGGDWWSPVLIGFADVIDTTIGATLVGWWVKEPTQIRVQQVALFVLAAAISTGIGALIGTAVSTTYLYPGMGYWPQTQLWWIGNWLGTVAFAPMFFVWGMAFWKTNPEVRLTSHRELAALCLLLPAITWYVFSTSPGDEASILQLPVMVFAGLTVAAFRVPPRWSVTLAAMAVLIISLLAVNQVGLFAVHESFSRMIHVQTFLATAAISTALLSIAIAEMRVKARRLESSEYRYRSFVEMSSEAVWCLEFVEPMPVNLPPEQMRDWFRRHGRIGECSLSFRKMDPLDAPDQAKPLRADSMWMDVYQRYLDEVAQQRFSSNDFRISAPVGGRPRVMLASFDGVVKDDKLVRIWGVARDVTELADLNARLQREQERLRSYARALTTAEERARRATAVDLHDGIGQSLIGMGMLLQVLRERVPPDERLMIDELKQRLHEVQERTRGMISDLSPPGLYELGLEPALNWLMVYHRGQDKLDVKLDCEVDESRVRLELRIQVFKLVRELLRNVIKHSGVRVAQVRVRTDERNLRLEVQDNGRGFDWQPDSSSVGKGGFGLWSIADRVAEFGGQFRVDSTPGAGARFDLIFPLPSERLSASA